MWDSRASQPRASRMPREPSGAHPVTSYRMHEHPKPISKEEITPQIGPTPPPPDRNVGQRAQNFPIPKPGQGNHAAWLVSFLPGNKGAGDNAAAPNPTSPPLAAAPTSPQATAPPAARPRNQPMNPLDRGQPGPLPGWITTWTDDGRVYFHHKERNVTTWDDPSGGVATLPQRHVPGEKRKRELETDAEAEARELEFLNQQSRPVCVPSNECMWHMYMLWHICSRL